MTKLQAKRVSLNSVSHFLLSQSQTAFTLHFIQAKNCSNYLLLSPALRLTSPTLAAVAVQHIIRHIFPIQDPSLHGQLYI